MILKASPSSPSSSFNIMVDTTQEQRERGSPRKRRRRKRWGAKGREEPKKRPLQSCLSQHQLQQRVGRVTFELHVHFLWHVRHVWFGLWGRMQRMTWMSHDTCHMILWHVSVTSDDLSVWIYYLITLGFLVCFPREWIGNILTSKSLNCMCIV